MNCQWCNATISDNTPTNLILVDGADPIPALCLKCWETAAVCDTCFSVHKYPDDISYTGEGYLFICHSCTGESLPCDECGKRHPKLTQVNGKDMCPSCKNKYFYCSECKVWHKKSKVQSIQDVEDLHLRYPLIYKSLEDKSICYDAFKKKIGPRTKERRVFRCKECGTKSNYVCKRDGVIYDYCKNCSTSLTKCTHCNGYEHGTRGRYVHMDRWVCKHCITNHYAKCNCCGYYREKGLIVDNVCPTCKETHFRCKACGYYSSNDRKRTVDNQHVCAACYSNMRPCTSCKQMMYKVYANGKCRSCSIQGGYAKIECYSTKPEPIFHGKDVLHYGFENEVSFRNDADLNKEGARILSAFSEDELLIKSDSSIDYGFEIVSQPHCYKKYQDKKWESLFLDTMKKSGSCGMHIHVNLESFTSFHLYKFLNFIHKHPTMITKISERQPNSYCELHDTATSEVVKKFKKNGERTPRYRRVNIGKKTIELRCFAGTTTYEQWRKNIEFIPALYYFTKDTSNMELNPKEWKLFLMKNKKEYPYLYKFMANLYTLPE